MLKRLFKKLMNKGTKMEQTESCRSCKHHYKDKLNHVRMCNLNQEIQTKKHVNQNGHVCLETVQVAGQAPCMAVSKNRIKCAGYKRNNRKPLQWRESE